MLRCATYRWIHRHNGILNKDTGPESPVLVAPGRGLNVKPRKRGVTKVAIKIADLGGVELNSWPAGGTKGR